MKTTKEVEEVCKKLKPVIGDKADKLWYMYLAEDDKGRKDLALDIEIIAEKVLKRDPLAKQDILLTPPSIDNSLGSFLIGDVVYNHKKLHSLYLRPEDFIKQIGIFAVTGEGKTNLAYLLALQLLKSKTPFIVIDWKRSWRNLLSLQDRFPELKQVQVYTIGRDALPFFWNPFRAPPGSDRELWISAIAEALEKSHLSGPGVAYYFNRIYRKLFKGLTSDFYPNFYDGLREIENIKAYQRELKWKQTALRIFQGFTIGSASRAFNVRNPIKLEHLLDKPVILELDLEMPKPLRIFFSEIILKWIHLYRLGQGETENLRHVLFLEEVHNLFSETGMYKETNSLENVYREIRAFGQGIVSITQHPSLLPIYLLGNCHTQIYLGLQHADDIRAARKSLFLPYDEESYPNMLKVGECIIKIKNRVEPCLVKTPLVPIKKGLITDDWLKVNTPSYLPKLHNGNQPNTPRYLPKANIGEKKGKNPNDNKAPHHRLLVDIFNNPLSGITQRYKKLKLNPKYGNKFKNLLISQGCIQPKKIITGKGWITLFELTQKGKMELRDLGVEFKNTSEGVVHKFWKHKISEYYRNRGLDVRVEEYYVNGRPDIIVVRDDKKIAVEIETGKSDYVRNVKQALEARFDKVICVATNKHVEEKIRKELEKQRICDDRVKVSSVFAFDL
ncbi:ATP-binding protein [Patescibacteria group bacterium]|nr:ATP-binding protein [Patescibacteria group bacterium]